MDDMNPYSLNEYNPQPSSSMLISPAPTREKTKRPQLSCNPCRARKVKCDRIQPCTACSLHQIAEICQYDLSETERQPILQAEALKEKDKAIAQLQHELSLLRGESIKAEPTEEEFNGQQTRKLRLPPRTLKRSTEHDNHTFPNNATDTSVFFDNPGMTNVADEFSHLSFNRLPSALPLTLDRSQDVFSMHIATSHPFPTLWSAKDDTSTMVKLLPPDEDLFFYVDAFQSRARASSFPYVPEESTHAEVQKFLENVQHNAALHPDTLALLFTTLALGLQDGVYDRCGEKWVAGSVETEARKGDVYIAAAMQCLRLSSFMNRPTLRSIATLVMMGPYLTNSGKFLDSSALFGATVRLAQSMGLHRDPLQVNALVSPKEEAVRRTLWWWMLQMDQQYSMTLSRPLAISVTGDCPSPEPIMTDPVMQSLSIYDSHFTILGRQILSSGLWSNPQIDKFSDDLLALERTMPGVLQFEVSWLNEEKSLPAWPLNAHAGLLHIKMHNLLILLNRQRVESSRSESGNNRYMRTSANANHMPRGRERVLHSCRSLLIAFEYFFTRVRAALICWSIGQMAFNAAMILTLSMLETGETQDLMPVQQVYSAFLEINKLGIHRLAGAAVDRLGNLMKEFRTEDSAKQTVMSQQGMMLLEDPGSPLSLSEDLPRLQHRISHAMANSGLRRSTLDHGTRGEGAAFAKKKMSKKSNAQRDSKNQHRGSKKSSPPKSQRKATDKDTSQQPVTARPSQRRRLNRSTPNLSIMTAHPGQTVFSATSTPTVKSETNMFTSQNFEGFPTQIFSGSPSQQQESELRLTLEQMNPSLQTSAQQSRQTHSHQSSQQQAQHPHSQHIQHSRSQQRSESQVHNHQRGIAQQHATSDAGNHQDFLFTNQTTPYSSEFFDDGMSSHNIDEHSNHPAFDHHAFPTAPFNVSGDVSTSYSTHF